MQQCSGCSNGTRLWRKRSHFPRLCCCGFASCIVESSLKIVPLFYGATLSSTPKMIPQCGFREKALKSDSIFQAAAVWQNLNSAQAKQNQEHQITSKKPQCFFNYSPIKLWLAQQQNQSGTKSHLLLAHLSQLLFTSSKGR